MLFVALFSEIFTSLPDILIIVRQVLLTELLERLRPLALLRLWDLIYQRLFTESSILVFFTNLSFMALESCFTFRSNHRRCSLRKGALRNFAKFTGKHLCQTLFFNKVVGFRPATLLKKRLWHRGFLVNFAKFLRTLFSQNTSRRLLRYLIESFRSGKILSITLKRKSSSEFAIYAGIPPEFSFRYSLF